MKLKYYVDSLEEPKLKTALYRLSGLLDHYYSCGIYFSDIITRLRPVESRVCTCGLVAALKVVKHSQIKGMMVAVHSIKKIDEDPVYAEHTRSSHHQEDH